MLRACSPGRFQAGANATACAACGNTSYAAAAAARACTACPAGSTVAGSPSTGCRACGPVRAPPRDSKSGYTSSCKTTRAVC